MTMENQSIAERIACNVPLNLDTLQRSFQEVEGFNPFELVESLIDPTNWSFGSESKPATGPYKKCLIKSFIYSQMPEVQCHCVFYEGSDQPDDFQFVKELDHRDKILIRIPQKAPEQKP